MSGKITIFVPDMKKIKSDGRRVVEIDDLSFLYDRLHFSWVGREVRHFRHKRALARADEVIASTPQAAADAHKYYRVDTSKIRGK